MNKVIKSRFVVLALTSAVINVGCVSSTPNPVPISQIGDDTKSCVAIISEMQQMQNQRLQAEGDRNAQVGGNVALGVLGAFLLVPWFFMDTSNAHTVEERAAIARYERLQQMAIDRKCPAVPVIQQTKDGVIATVNEGEGQVERITITTEGQSKQQSSNELRNFDEARDICGKTFKEMNEQYGNCVLRSSSYKPMVVSQIGYSKVCENIGFKVHTPGSTQCINDLMSRQVQ